MVIDDSSWKNATESFTVALTLTLGGYESAIAPFFIEMESPSIKTCSIDIICKSKSLTFTIWRHPGIYLWDLIVTISIFSIDYSRN